MGDKGKEKLEKTGTIGQYTVRNWIYFPFLSQEKIILYLKNAGSCPVWA